jgi:Secretion system C-terminal sorting domain
MKKNFILFLLCGFLANANAQLTNLWTKAADASGSNFVWFNTTAFNATTAPTGNINNVASLAYNPITNKVLVSNRNNNVYIINVATGASEGTLSVVGLGAEAFKFNKIRVTDDGVIYGISLATGATSACKIYRWADQVSAPTLCASFTVTERTGDAFGLSGTGANTVLYASGAGLTSGAFSIYILNTADGSNFSLESKVTMASSPTASQQWANRVVEPDGTGVNSDIWIKGGGFNARKISVGPASGGVRTGTVITTIPDGTTGGQASLGYGGMRLMNISGTKYLLFSGGNNAEAGTVLRSLNVTNETAITLNGTLSYAAAYATNGNGSGDVSYKINADGSYNVFYLSTNNAFGATGSSSIPVELMNFTAKLKNKQTLLNWSTASEINNAGFSVERSINGADYAEIGVVKPQFYNTGIRKYDFTDATLPENERLVYYRLKQIDNDGKHTYSPVVSIKRSNDKLSLSAVYPMPVSEGVTLDIVSHKAGKITATVTDIVGKVVKTDNFTVEEGSNSLPINLSQLAKGAYFISLSNGEARINQRIIKQ